MKRFSNWPELLAAFLESRKNEPFEWGKNDCALFSCDAILAMTGTDIGAEFRNYSDEAGAHEQIARFGSLEALANSVCQQHGMAAIRPTFAQRGDLVLFESRLGPTLGIVSLDGTLIASPGPLGLQYSPVRAATVAWRSG